MKVPVEKTASPLYVQLSLVTKEWFNKFPEELDTYVESIDLENCLLTVKFAEGLAEEINPGE